VNGPACVLAWLLTEGDMLPGGETVLSVQRNPVSGTVSITATDGTHRRFQRDDRVTIAARPAAAPPPWRLTALVTAARRGRRPGS
jgi:hypothetical protein